MIRRSLFRLQQAGNAAAGQATELQKFAHNAPAHLNNLPKMEEVPKPKPKTGKSTFWYFAVGGTMFATCYLPYTYWWYQVEEPRRWREMRDRMHPPPNRRTEVFTAGTAGDFVATQMEGKRLHFYIGVICRIFALIGHMIPIMLHVVISYARGESTAFDVNDAILQLFQEMGPTYVKLGQWVASRPDVFPDELCKKLSMLFDDAPPHAWEHTEKILREANILKELSSVEKEPLNSGSVAQVHRATLRDGKPISSSSRQQPLTVLDKDEMLAYIDAEEMVILKVLHPNIHDLMLTDLVALRYIVNVMDLIPGVEFFSLKQNLAEFSSMVMSQLDLEREADNLTQFLHNFRYSKHVCFPIPLLDISTKNVLVETFEVGTPIYEIGPSPSLAKIGCKMFMQMLFRDNFTHADLHPGNVMVRYKRKTDGKLFAKLPNDLSRMDSTKDIAKKRQMDKEYQRRKAMVGDKEMKDLSREERHLMGKEFVNKSWEKSYDQQLVVLDPGLITTLNEKERTNFIALFTAVACGDGDLGAKLMLERSPSKHRCDNVENFQKDMREIFDAVGPGSDAGFSLSKIDIGHTLTKVFQTMRDHCVRIDGNFASLVLTVLVGEALGRKMHPDYNIFAEATPWLVKELEGHELEHLILELQRVYGTKEIFSMGMDSMKKGH